MRPSTRINGCIRFPPHGFEMPEFLGPSLRAIPFGPGGKDAVDLLSARQRSQIAGIATSVPFQRGKLIYREGTNAQSVFIVANGIVKLFRDLPSGKRRVMAFLFAETCSDSRRAVTTSTAPRRLHPSRCTGYAPARWPTSFAATRTWPFSFSARSHTSSGALLDIRLILTRRDALGRVTMFLRLLEQNSQPGQKSTIEVPMSRLDAANYLGLSLEAVSRALSQSGAKRGHRV